MRVFKFNFHLKDFKDRVPDRNERKCIEKNIDNVEKELKRTKSEKGGSQMNHEEISAVAPVKVAAIHSVEEAIVKTALCTDVLVVL